MYLNLHLHCGPTKSSQHHNALYQQQHEVVFHEQIPGQHKLLLQAKALSFHKCLGENTELITKRGVFWQYNSNNNNKAFSPNKLGQARAETHKISQPTHGSGTWIASFHAPLSMASSLVIYQSLQISLVFWQSLLKRIHELIRYDGRYFFVTISFVSGVSWTCVCLDHVLQKSPMRTCLIGRNQSQKFHS